MPAKIPLTQEFLDQVAKLYAENLGQHRIARELSCSKRLVKNAYKMLHIDPSIRLNPPPLTERICRDCKINKPIDQYLKRTRATLVDGTKSGRVSYETRCKECYKIYQNDFAGQNRKGRQREYRQKPRLSSEFLAQVKQLFDGGVVGIPRIADKLNCKPNRIQRAFKLLNISSQETYNPRKEVPGEKVCTKCNTLKPITEYAIKHRNTSYGGYDFYHSQCKDCIRLEKNIRESKRSKIRRKTDPAYRLRSNMSTIIYTALRERGSGKNGDSCWKFLPYTPGQLVAHIESLFSPWMTWQNHGKYDPKTWHDGDPATWTWQLDHIIPHSTFKYASMKSQEFQSCWALSNLRPYSAKQNILDSNSR
jgi:hypothetical protein